MATPAETDFIITQGDSLPVMRIPIPANADGQLLDLADCTVVLYARAEGTRTAPAPIARPMESYAEETQDFGDGRGEVPVIAVYVHFEQADTIAPSLAIPTGSHFLRCQGELKITDADGEVLRIWDDPERGMDFPYLGFWIRDDVAGDA